MANSQAKDLTRGDPKRVLFSFTVPLLLSQLFQQLYNSVDSLIVGNFLGKEALAAVGSTGSLVFLMVSFFAGIATGAGVVISRHFGARDHELVRKSIHTNVLFGLLAGVFLTIVGLIFTPTILRWMGTAQDVMPQSVSYLRWYYIGAIPMVMYNTLTGIMQALGDSRRPLYFLLLSSVLNVILDLLFVGGFHWGVGSAALATSIAQGVSMLLCLRTLMKKDAPYPLRLRELRFHGVLLREIIRNGLPTGVQNSVIAFANVLVQTNINSFGSDAMAACGAYSKLEGFVFLPISSFSMALTTFIGQNLGARQYERAKQGGRFGIIVCVVMAQITGVLLILLAPQLIGLFNADPEVVAIGVRQIRLEAPFYFLLSFSHSVAGVCRGAGKAVVPMLVMLSVWCVLRIIYITVIMSIIHQIEFLFLAYPLTWAISSTIFLIYYLKSDWIHGFDKQPLLR